MRYLDVEDFLNMSDEEKLEAYYLGYILQEQQYTTVPRQMPTQIGYLGYIPDSVKQGDTFPIVISIAGLAQSPLDFYITLKDIQPNSYAPPETIQSYMGDYGEISCSFLHTVNENPGTYLMEAWIIDSNGTQALVDSKKYTVLYDNNNKNLNSYDNRNYVGVGLMAVIGGFLGLSILGVL